MSVDGDDSEEYEEREEDNEKEQSDSKGNGHYHFTVVSNGAVDMDVDGDESEEYEEIEEEIQVEEDSEKEHSDSQDVSREMELAVHKEHLISDSFGPDVGNTGESRFSIVSEAKDEASVYVDESLKLGTHLFASDDLESFDDKKDPVAFVEKGGALDNVDSDNGKAFLDHGCVTAEPSVVYGKEVATAISTNNGSAEEANGVMDVETDIKEGREHNRKDISEGMTSSSLLQTRLRSLSPVPELNVMNKRPAAICSFFVKGWCIKGNSCKFLHVKDHASINSAKSERDEGKIELQSDIGVGDSTEKSEAIGFPMTTISPVSLKRSQSRELGESHHFNKSHEILPHQQEGSSHWYKDNSRSNPSFGDFGGDNMKLNSVEDNSINRSRHFPDSFSTFSLSTPTSGPLPSFSSSKWTRAHFLTRSLDKDPFHAYGSTSLRRSSSPFSGSESKNHSLKDFSMDPLPVANHRNKIYYDDWESSVPFRPSFPYTKNLLAPLTLYDPIRDSIEKPKPADLLPKLPSRLDTTITSTHRSTDKDPALRKTSEPENGSDKQSISGHQKFRSSSDKDIHNRYLLSTEGETMGAYNDEQNSGSNLPKEENPSRHDEQYSGSNLPNEEKHSRHVIGKDRAEAKKIIHDSNLRPQKNGITRKKESNIDIGRDEEHRESKAMRIFRVALIDFVKDLVKPTWLEGRVSKDAHKKIVKNAVEKVLSTVQPHETPSTEESINQYLSISKPKMAKLVEGYVVKYGKS